MGHNPCVLRVPMVGRNLSGDIARAFSCLLWAGEVKEAMQPVPSRGPLGGDQFKWLHGPSLLGLPMVGRIQSGFGNPSLREIIVAT